MNPRDVVRAHFGRAPAPRRELADVVREHASRHTPAVSTPHIDCVVSSAQATREAVLARLRRPSPVPDNLRPDVLRQVRRILASMREFGFDSGGYWWTSTRDGSFEDGWTPRHGGDPINTTIQEVAGCYATRADVIEAADAVVSQRRPKLRPGLVPLVGAVVTVAEALAAGRRVVLSDEVGAIRIQGPTLPPNWDEYS